MMIAATRQTVCRHFASLLGYPDATTRATATACAALLRETLPEAGASFDGFLCFLDSHAAARLEEIYTATFDLQPACHPYVGYQLCGENQKRALFLMQLQQLYRQHGFAATGELPDHLATMLRFVAEVDDRQCCEELVRDGLIPALDKMLAQAEFGEHPYARLLRALQLFLVKTTETTVLPGEFRQKEVNS